MKIAIVGPGAMGLLFAGILKEKGNDVILVDKDPKRARFITRSGIRIKGVSGDHRVDIRATTRKREIKDRDLIILCVKSYDTATAARSIARHINKDAVVLTLQNGIGNIEALAKYIPKNNIIAGVISHGATLLGPGRVKHAGKGETIIGRSGGRMDNKLEQVKKILVAAGFKTKIVKNINDYLWSKLVVNACINPLTAITRLKNGQLLLHEETLEIMKEAARESQAVARKAGIKLAYPDAFRKAKEVCRATAGNTSSMLQDVLRGRKTEIDNINGAIVGRAKKCGLRAPGNEQLAKLVKTLEGRQLLDDFC